MNFQIQTTHPRLHVKIFTHRYVLSVKKIPQDRTFTYNWYSEKYCAGLSLTVFIFIYLDNLIIYNCL